jgi:hypothetical protein
VLGLDELPDDEAIEHSDEPFDVDAPARALVLREVLATHLREPARELATIYDEVVADLELRGRFPVGVFGTAARGKDLDTLGAWREELGPIAVGSATRLAFGRSTSKVADLRAAIPLDLGGGRSVRLVGQTELLLDGGGRYTSVVPLVGEASKKGHHHLRGAFDHLVLAAANLATRGHAHVLLDRDGKALRVDHAPWTPEEARSFLAGLVGELLDRPHGYVLPFDQLVRALEGKQLELNREPNRSLRFGPVQRLDGLALAPDAIEIAERRLRPLANRMTGEHSIGEVK